ncbi:Histone-lysine N-methyltransferase ASH1L [Phytophthora citrophthora]|uniref:Histone-lysine N-methyltransferase ASH1L n=1 Tax=Phytophthora citrophthora TaxID=4793 RepID=A0AAD9LAI6_9STRA|nr:Histone-lysine N-methyltransferase ASH1L [Phytophthora citrophthora]
MGGNWLTPANLFIEFTMLLVQGDAPICTCELYEGEEIGCLDHLVHVYFVAVADNRRDWSVLSKAVRVVIVAAIGSFRLAQHFKTAVVDCGRKGVGVITLEDITEGCLVGEYVGGGGQDAQLRTQISADAVIDATRIGGRMRFVNHSCDPNCKVEKWCVRGQARCGLFAIRHVTAGEEVTIDYNFHSVNAEV